MNVREQPKVQAYVRWPLFVGIIGLSMIALYMFTGITKDPNAQKDQKANPVAAVPAFETPLMSTKDKPSGLINAAATPQKEAAKEEPAEDKPFSITVVAAPKVDQSTILTEEDQKRRMAAYTTALSAPLGMVRSSGGSSMPSSQGGQFGQMDMVQEKPSEQMEKENFLSRASKDSWRSPYTKTSGSTYELKTGTVIPGVMLTGINSDLPGSIIGQVMSDVYDSATGRWVLIPKGSRLYGVYDSRISQGQRRVLIAWNRIIFPDSSSITLGAMPGVTSDGYAGFTDKIDNHYFRIFGNALVMSLIGGGMAYGMDKMNPEKSNTNNSTPSLQESMGTALLAQLGEASLELLRQNMTIKPTLEIRPGYTFSIVLTQDLAFEVPYGH